MSNFFLVFRDLKHRSLNYGQHKETLKPDVEVSAATFVPEVPGRLLGQKSHSLVPSVVVPRNTSPNLPFTAYPIQL
jgi:hypothetical protein